MQQHSGKLQRPDSQRREEGQHFQSQGRGREAASASDAGQVEGTAGAGPRRRGSSEDQAG